MRAPVPWVRVALAAIALGVALGPVDPVSAAPPGILVSLDGVTWMPGPVAGPLPPLGPLVPGGTGHWVVHIRNASSVSAMLRISASVDASAEYSTVLSLAAEVGAVHGPAQLSAASECLELLSGIELTAGAQTAVTIVASVDVDAGEEVQGQTATAVVYATLVEIPGAIAGPACPLSPSQPTNLPPQVARTGTDGSAVLPVAFCALAATLLGSLLTEVRRRSRRERLSVPSSGRRR